MRQEYINLQAVEGLTIKNMSLNHTNIIEELKSHQEEVTQSIKDELKENFMEIICIFNMANQENIPPNITPIFNSQGQAQDETSNEIDPTEANMFARAKTPC